MTPEFPALQDALVAAARRRIRRRRRFQIVIPTLVAAAAAALVVFVSVGSAPRERERPAIAPSDLLSQSFAVFRRPRTASDVLPSTPDYLKDLDTSRSRLVTSSGSARLFVVPRGRPVGVCLILVTPKETDGDCKSRTAAVSPPFVMNFEFYGTGYRMLLMPDSVSDVRLTTSSGRSIGVTLHDGGALVPSRPAYEAVGWTGPLDRRYVLRLQITKPLGPTPQGCPALGALPAGAVAQAKRAALLAVDRLYPAIREATITSAARAKGTPCSAATTRQTVEVDLHLITADPSQRRSASLSQGRLLLGMVDGRMTVYAVQH